MAFKGNRIKELLMDLRLVLGNNHNHFEADYHISASGVPYVHVMVNGERYQFTFFGRTQKFRVFKPDQSKVDLVDRQDLLDYFRAERDRTSVLVTSIS